MTSYTEASGAVSTPLVQCNWHKCSTYQSSLHGRKLLQVVRTPLRHCARRLGEVMSVSCAATVSCARARLCSDLRATRLRTRSPAMPRPIKSAPNARAESPRLASALSRTRRPSRSVQPHSRWPPYTPSPPPPIISLLLPMRHRNRGATGSAINAVRLSNPLLVGSACVVDV